MPIVATGGGYRYGRTGKLYRGKGAYKKALAQARAIKASQARRKKGRKHILN